MLESFAHFRIANGGGAPRFTAAGNPPTLITSQYMRGADMNRIVAGALVAWLAIVSLAAAARAQAPALPSLPAPTRGASAHAPNHTARNARARGLFAGAIRHRAALHHGALRKRRHG